MSATTVDVDTNFISVPIPRPTGWQVAAAQKRGSRHEASGANCEDAYYVVQPVPGLLVIAIADGAGSAKFAEIGANVAVQHGAAHVCAGWELVGDTLGDSIILRLLEEAMSSARSAVQAEAATREVEFQELASTMILVIAHQEFVAAAQIGDGAVVVADAAGEVFSLTAPVQGEYFNETVFLTARNALQIMQLKLWRGEMSGVAAFSDGLQLLCLEWPECLAHASFFKPLLEFIRDTPEEARAASELAEFLHSERVGKLTDDDVTLVVATLRNDHEEG